MIIWLLAISFLSALIFMGLLYRYIFKELHTFWQALHDVTKLFPTIPECRFKDYEFRWNEVDEPCRYSPGSEPERICALREADKKGGQTFIREAPQWDRSSGSSDEK